MDNQPEWTFIGKTDELKTELEATGFLKELEFNERKIVLSLSDGQFGALNNKCNHMGGPLSQGKLKNGCIECPWHYWGFHHQTGEAAPGSFEPLASHGGNVPSLPLKIEAGALYINLNGESQRTRPEYNAGSGLGREPNRAPGRIRVLGLSTTAMD